MTSGPEIQARPDPCPAGYLLEIAYVFPTGGPDTIEIEVTVDDFGGSFKTSVYVTRSESSTTFYVPPNALGVLLHDATGFAQDTAVTVTQ